MEKPIYLYCNPSCLSGGSAKRMEREEHRESINDDDNQVLALPEEVVQLFKTNEADHKDEDKAKEERNNELLPPWQSPRSDLERTMWEGIHNWLLEFSLSVCYPQL